MSSSYFSKLWFDRFFLRLNFVFGELSLHSLFTLNCKVLPKSSSVSICPVADFSGLTFNSNYFAFVTLALVKNTLGLASKGGCIKGSCKRSFSISLSRREGCQTSPINLQTYLGKLVPKFFFNSPKSTT